MRDGQATSPTLHFLVLLAIGLSLADDEGRTVDNAVTNEAEAVDPGHMLYTPAVDNAVTNEAEAVDPGHMLYTPAAQTILREKRSPVLGLCRYCCRCCRKMRGCGICCRT